MERGYETSEVRQQQVDLAAIGGEIFSVAAETLASNTPAAYEGKPLGCLKFYFERSYHGCRYPMLPDEVRSEKLVVSVTDPNRLDEYDITRKDSDIFLCRSISDGVKRIIGDQIQRACQKTIGERDADYYRVPACAITTQYELEYLSGNGLSIDTTVHRPLMPMLISGRLFATEVAEYMRSEVYQKFPVSLPEIEKKYAGEEDSILHSAKISFATRPPLNGSEPKAWLEQYAEWLRQSIKQMTFGPEEPKSAAEFRGISDSAMDDGILLMKTLDAIRWADY